MNVKLLAAKNTCPLSGCPTAGVTIVLPFKLQHNCHDEATRIIKVAGITGYPDCPLIVCH